MPNRKRSIRILHVQKETTQKQHYRLIILNGGWEGRRHQGPVDLFPLLPLPHHRRNIPRLIRLRPQSFPALVPRRRLRSHRIALDFLVLNLHLRLHEGMLRPQGWWRCRQPTDLPEANHPEYLQHQLQLRLRHAESCRRRRQPTERCRSESIRRLFQGIRDAVDILWSVETTLIYTPGGQHVSDHLAQQCLSTLQPSLLYDVCLSWRRLIYSPSFPPFFSLYAVLCETTSTKYPFIKSVQLGRWQCQPNSIAFFSFDPISSTWKALPTPPTDPPMCILRQHPSFISRILSIQSLTVSGRLVLIAATTHKLLPALTHPLVFNPLSGKWYHGPPFSSPRRWCVAGSMNGGIYVASGIGAQYNVEVARSMERWDMSKKDVDWHWETRVPFKDGKFSREAVEALGYRGKLCMVNVKGKAVKEGAVYDVVMNQWQEMPKGMRDGWNGPAAVDNDSMYVVDQENGSLSRYNADGDCWEEVIEPSELLKGAEHLSAHKGKICAVFANGGKIIVADILAKPAKVWVVNPPQGMEVISVHVLPRMSVPEY